MPQRLRTEGIVLVPALSVVALLVWWAADGGGYAPTTWEPSALVVLGLLAATVAGLGLARVRPTRPLALALALLAGFVAFSYLSIAWAPTRAEALEGSNRALLFLLLFALFAVLPWRTWTALTTLSAFALGIGAVAVVTLVQLGDGDAADVASMFVRGRLAAPLDYMNGTAALFLTGALVSVALGARRELPPLARGVLLAGATAALSASVLPESRGWLFALAPVLLLTFLLVPGRVRLALWMLVPVVATLVVLPALLDVFEQVDAASADPAAAREALVATAQHASSSALIACGVVLLAALVLTLADRAATVPAPVTRRTNQLAAVLVPVAVAAGIVAGLAATDGRPDRTLADYWDRSNGYQAATPGSSRFGLAGSNRPDFWRVSLDAFAAHPLGGLGQDNWDEYYLRHRRSDEQPRWPHSLELRLLVHTGVVGFLLFAAFLAAALVAALAGRRRAPQLTVAAGAVALLPLVVWLVHGSIDWFWEIPALSGPAFAFLALGGALTRRDELVPALGRPARVVAGGALAVAGLLAAAALALPWLSARDVAEAGSGWARDPAAAFDRLDRAARLNPLSAEPDLVAGVIALELGRPRIAADRFTAAIERDRDDWFAWFGRGLAASEAGDRRTARDNYERARLLNPGDALIGEARARVNGDRPLTAREAFASLRRDVQRLTR